MKKSMCLVIICIPLLIHAQDRGIKFEQSLTWEQLKAKAKAENKYIFMDVFATWCVPCKKMDKEIYPNDTLGGYINGKFISIKVQMDSSNKDNEQVKSWYADARDIGTKYKIDGYPSFFFFSPDGNLVFKGLGYQNVSELIKLGEKALDPQSLLYYAQLEEYKNGNKNYEEMKDLAVFTKNIIGDIGLAKQIGEDYLNHTDRKQLLTKDNILFILNLVRNKELADSLAIAYKISYLDKLSEEEICTKENIKFINQFSRLLTSKDNLFSVCYYYPEKVYSVMNEKGWADFHVRQVITREEMAVKLLKDGEPIFKDPNWEQMKSIIQKKYEKVDAKQLVLKYQISYYKKLKDWKRWAKYQDEKIKTSTLKFGDGFWELNLPAWDAFLYCNDRQVLEKALEWSDLSIKIDEPNPNLQCLDTKANLLYKLGKIKEAIALEKKALELLLPLSKKEGINIKLLMDSINSYTEVINKMNKGEPTYLEEGAVWNSNTLPKKNR